MSEKTFKIATLAMRYFTFMVDMAILCFIYFSLLAITSFFSGKYFLLLVFIYFFLLPLTPISGTLSYALAGLKIVRKDGKKIDMKTSLIRFVTSLISMVLIFPNLFIFSKDKQTLQDATSNTLVINQRYNIGFTFISIILQVPFFVVLFLLDTFIGIPKLLHQAFEDKNTYLYKYLDAPCLDRNITSDREIILLEARGRDVLGSTLKKVTINSFEIYDVYLRTSGIFLNRDEFYAIDNHNTAQKELKLYDKNESFKVLGYYRCEPKSNGYCSMYLLQNRDGNIGWMDSVWINTSHCRVKKDSERSSSISVKKGSLVKTKDNVKSLTKGDELYTISKRHFEKLKSERRKLTP